jgi:FkbM family methyltransferase
MTSTFKIKLGDFLFKHCFPLYKITYQSFKEKQDAFEISLIKQYTKPNDTVIDIGANIGFYAEILSNAVGASGKVHCFEPDTTNFNYLKKRCASLKNVIANNKAVSDKPGLLTIYTSKHLNVDHRTYKPDDYDKEIDIDAVDIDSYLNGQPVNFIKMDIQGFEMSAVLGMHKTFQNHDLKMLSEFWPYGMRIAGTSVLDYFQFLKTYHFFVYLIEENTLIELTEEKVTSFLDFPESRYMNIFASKSRV